MILPRNIFGRPRGHTQCVSEILSVINSFVECLNIILVQQANGFARIFLSLLIAGFACPYRDQSSDRKELHPRQSGPSLRHPSPHNPTILHTSTRPIREWESGRSSAVGEGPRRCIICTRDIDSKSPSAPTRRCLTRTTGTAGTAGRGETCRIFSP